MFIQGSVYRVLAVSIAVGLIGCTAGSEESSDSIESEVRGRPVTVDPFQPSQLGPRDGLTITIAKDRTGAPVLDAAGNATLYATVRDGFGSGIIVMRSTDSGATFSRVGEPLTLTGLSRWDNAPSIHVAPSNPSVLYLVHEQYYSWGFGTQGEAHLLQSTDGGASWTPVKHGVDDDGGAGRGFSSLDINPDNPNHLVAANCAGVQKSVDGGRSWGVLPGSRFGIGSCNGATLIRGVNDRKTIYVAWHVGEGGGQILSRTTDDAVSWQEVSTTFVDTEWHPGAFDGFVVDPADARHVYVSGYDGFFSSADGGQTFHPHNRGLPTRADSPAEYRRLSPVAIDTTSQPPSGQTATLFISFGDEVLRWTPTNEPENGHWEQVARVADATWSSLSVINTPRPRLLALTEALYDDGINRGPSALQLATIRQ